VADVEDKTRSVSSPEVIACGTRVADVEAIAEEVQLATNWSKGKKREADGVCVWT